MRGSIIIVSRHRPQALARCITALRQQSYPALELIVVADPAACAALAGQGDVKIMPFDVANISAARNLGLSQAAGDVALFIDDDAVAAPHWAALLIAALGTPSVVAATGYVRGRNGISYQWRASMPSDRIRARRHRLEVHQYTPACTKAPRGWL
ncbi:MAG: glycosyltransferase [Cypionkella sp.]|nr:glycosyltransferase [Cypionkella sp.]